MKGSEYFVIASIAMGEELRENKLHSSYSILVDEDSSIYEAAYIKEGTSAMTDFLDSQKADQKIKWELLKDKIYIGENAGYNKAYHLRYG